MSASILAGRGAMFGTLAAGMFLLAALIAAVLLLKVPLAPLLLIGVAVAVTLGLLLFVSSCSAVPWWPTDWLSLASFAAVIALAYGAFAYFIFMTKPDRELVSSVPARRSAS
ncbi:MAG: hypothetical protein K0S56_598 [Microvirga sp.]|jgi:hypothetical protein|nr:hypothetical protein [Microvirga sp.]